MTQPPDDGDTQDLAVLVADIVAEHCPRMRPEAGYTLTNADAHASFGDGVAEFEGPTLRWRFTRDKSYLTADVAARDPGSPGGWDEWVQFLNVLHALGDEAAVEGLFASGQRGRRGYRALGRLVDSRHAAVEAAMSPAERAATLARAAAAQAAYVRSLYG